MSHRNSKPKPHASERTWRRWRINHNLSTQEDDAHVTEVTSIKEKVLEFLNPKPKPEIEVPVKVPQ